MHLSELVLQNFFDRELNEAECVKVQLHLDGCEHCSRKINALREAVQAYSPLFQQPLPAVDEECIARILDSAQEILTRDRVPAKRSLQSILRLFMQKMTFNPTYQFSALTVLIASVVILRMQPLHSPIRLNVPKEVAHQDYEAMKKAETLAYEKEVEDAKKKAEVCIGDHMFVHGDSTDGIHKDFSD